MIAELEESIAKLDASIARLEADIERAVSAELRGRLAGTLNSTVNNRARLRVLLERERDRITQMQAPASRVDELGARRRERLAGASS